MCIGSKQPALPPKGNTKKGMLWERKSLRIWDTKCRNEKKPASWQKENTGVNRHWKQLPLLPIPAMDRVPIPIPCSSGEPLRSIKRVNVGIITQPLNPPGIFLRIVNKISKKQNIWNKGAYWTRIYRHSLFISCLPRPRQGRADSRHPCSVISQLQETFWNCHPICKDRR